MTYILDTNCFIVMGHYFPNRFPSFWNKFDEMVEARKIISVKEVFRELDSQASKEHLRNWITAHKDLFMIPTMEEMAFVGKIFAVPRFEHLIKEKNRLNGGPEADPFIIAAAKVRGACVVTEERKKGDAIKIPLVCEHFDIECVNFELLMEREGWVF